MATVPNNDGNDEFPVDTHLASKLEKIADGMTTVDMSGVEAKLDTLDASVQDVKDSVDAQTPILNDIKSNTTPVEP